MDKFHTACPHPASATVATIWTWEPKQTRVTVSQRTLILIRQEMLMLIP